MELKINIVGVRYNVKNMKLFLKGLKNRRERP